MLISYGVLNANNGCFKKERKKEQFCSDIVLFITLCVVTHLVINLFTFVFDEESYVLNENN